MIPNSVFISIGEAPQAMEQVEQGLAPCAEFAVLRRGHFTKVIAMRERDSDPGSYAVGARFALQSYLESWGAKNVYLGEEFPGIQYLALQALLRRPKRIAMLVHNATSLKRRVPLGTMRLGRLADRILCLCEQSRRELVTGCGVPAARVVVIGSRVDTTFFQPDSARPVLEQVCSAGAVNRDYGTLVEAVRPLGIPTKIAADTAWRYSTRPMGPASVPAHVEMRSWENYVNLRELYARSAVVVVPLRRAMMSGVTVALEAMAMAKPVIVTRNAYVEDFLRHGETGFFVRAGDEEDLRARIRWILEHPDEAARVGARAREWVLERFTVERYVEKIVSVWS
jgi:glycosyltransferase involved in cell wall biosynthesis